MPRDTVPLPEFLKKNSTPRQREKAAIKIANFLLACLPGVGTLVFEQRQKMIYHMIIGELTQNGELNPMSQGEGK